jgi:hypothetical protein
LLQPSTGHSSLIADCDVFGWGRVDNLAAVTSGAPTPTPTPTPGPITLSALGRKVGGVNTVRLIRNGATSDNIDVNRNGIVIATVQNTGTYTDSTGDTGRARYTYKVCTAGTSTCSNEVTVRFRQ